MSKNRIYPQEVIVVADDISIDAVDLGEFLSQGGTLTLMADSRCLVQASPSGDAAVLGNEWRRIRRSCGAKYRSVSMLNALDGSSLAFQRCAFVP